MNDQELIKGCIAEDRRCQNALYKKYFPLMSSIAIRYVANREEAIYKLNHGFLKVLQNLHQYDPQYAFATFIRNVLINFLIDEFRKEKKYLATIELSDYSDTDAGVTYNLGEAQMEAEELLQILNGLPEVTKKVFNLFAIDGFKHQEIGDMLGISAGTSKWHVSEARKQLKEILSKQFNQEKKRGELAR